MKKEKLVKFSRKLVSDGQTPIQNLRRNLSMYISSPDITLKDISEGADISFDTLKNLIYQNTRDCKLSTVVSIANALEVTVDELVGANTFSKEDKECIDMFREMPEYYQYFIRWFIKRQYQMLNNNFRDYAKTIPVVSLEENNDGTLHLSKQFATLDITTVPKNLKAQIFMGISLNTNNYMPFYSDYDTVLIANDRPPKANENSVIIYGNNVFIAHRNVCKNKNGKYEYASIRDRRFLCVEEDADDIIGYIIYILPPPARSSQF